MSIITMPAGLSVGQFAISQHRYDLNEMSDSTGATQTRIMGPPRWGLAIASGNIMSLAQASLWEAMVLSLRGGINHLAAWDIVRVAPRGTARGTLSVQTTGGVPPAAGAVQMQIDSSPSQVGMTLLAGDWLQVGSGLTGQLIKLIADCTFGSSVGQITFEAPLRIGYAAGTAVAWDKPKGHYKMTTDAPAWAYAPGSNTVSGFAMDLLEQW